MKKDYDLLIVGAGIYGATAAYKAKQEGKRCLVIDQRPHLGGNIYCEQVEGINVHKYGAHIFHTNNKKVWEFANSIVAFNRYTNSPIANYKGRQEEKKGALKEGLRKRWPMRVALKRMAFPLTLLQ